MNLREKFETKVPAAHHIESLEGKVSAEEWALRVDLAATYRLVAMYGWDDMIFTHISARVPGPEHHFLINPYGLLFEEITASSLVKIDVDGNKVGDSPYPVNPAGFTIHSALHMNRDDAHCVIHLHTDDGVAVSAQADGLLPLDQHAMVIVGDIAYHDYEGIALDLDERDRLVADIGKDKHVMMLRNHGTLTLGKSCADAFMRMYYLERSCTMQVRALSGGAKPNMPNQGVPEKTAAQGQMAFEGLLGALAWPALLRKLDRLDPGFRH
jgi:ribulose-5-phosphate 4-epimerase/fuculose-1-phosphate aldolase